MFDPYLDLRREGEGLSEPSPAGQRTTSSIKTNFDIALIKCQYTLSISYSLIKYTYFILICCSISML